MEEVRTADIPHPFDTHPPLEERLAAAGASTRLEDAAAILAARPERTWADEIRTGAAIEARLWGEYERRFQASHDESLAYRYLPATEEERAHVRGYFRRHLPREGRRRRARRKDAPGERTLDIKLRPLGDGDDAFKLTVRRYWERSQVARAAQAVERRG